jgi:hypothetical protein
MKHIHRIKVGTNIARKNTRRRNSSRIRTKAPMGTTRAITPKSSTPLTSSYKPKKKDKQFIFK